MSRLGNSGPRNAAVSYLITDMPYVKTGVDRRVGGQPRSQLIPASQAGNMVFLATARTLVSQFPNTMFAAAGKKSSVIPNIDFIKHLVMKVEITLSDFATLVPCQYWMDEFALRDSGNNEVIQRHYDDTSLQMMLFKCSAGRQRPLFKSGLNMESHETGKYGLTLPLRPGTHTFYIPVISAVFENFNGIYLNDLQGDLLIDWTTPSTIVASGPGTVTNTVISFLAEGAVLNDQMGAEYAKLYRASAVECQFLQPHRSEFLSQTMTAGQVNKLPLRSVDGLCAFQTIMIRPQGNLRNNTNFATWQLLNIGDSNGAAIDLTTSSGESILGRGSPIPTRWTRQHQSIDMFDNDFVARKPLYILAYTESVNGALSGRIRGGYQFEGTRGDEIRITLPPAPIQEVQTVTLSGTAPGAGSFYMFEFRGERSALIPVASTAAVMKSTIEAMREVKARYMTVTASAALSAGTSFTLTIADPEGTLDGDMFRVFFDAAGTSASASTARTVAAVPGLVSGQYDIYVYSWLYNTCGYVNNKLRSDLLIA